MGVQDAYQSYAPGSQGERSAGQYSAYRHSGPMDSALLNGRHGSHGCVSSDHLDDALLFPHQPSDGADHTDNAGSAAASLDRKRKTEEADVAVIDLTGDSPPSSSKRQRPPATPKRKRKYNLSHTESDERNGIRYQETIRHATKRTISQARNGTEEVPKSIAKHARKGRSKDADKEAQSHAAEDTGENPKKQKKAKQDGEKRLRRWRSHAPSAYQEIRNRALTQRMFALDRQRSNDNPEHPSETISLAGTTGNVYTICIDKVPTCNCPYAKKGNQCKHVVYVLSRVLRAPSELEYQLAFTSSELRDIFANAPLLPSETASNDAQDGNRKPVEGECPICCNDFEPGSSETIVYCRAACGNNVHKDCFAQWAATKRGQTITCPFCRSPWQDDEANLPEIAKGASTNAEGYVNVASQLGLSGRRDYSTYNSYWVRGQARRGRIAWNEDGVMDHEY
ncbi:hypothetical protein MBLNU13_g01362t1 [Cladosporium sp. NU13]